ncbi:hypothetical protein TSAR_004879 [Trichomalopsis sarcophagae]|uniref:Uncharacterized protein n=1 Tax=Trichomalopsis sarcophagae TaxID=543379 RepID=A0A232EW52_9HYME|nr:hypothetical protein TSAR_004879 [Trichomalopsis sarcophagae]
MRRTNFHAPYAPGISYVRCRIQNCDFGLENFVFSVYSFLIASCMLNFQANQYCEVVNETTKLILNKLERRAIVFLCYLKESPSVRHYCNYNLIKMNRKSNLRFLGHLSEKNVRKASRQRNRTNQR